MLVLDDAIARLQASARLLSTPEKVAVGEALNRVLAEDVTAGIDVPPADNSAMDGYALRRADWPGPDKAVIVSQRITAGAVPGALEPGTAARIFTGAQVPGDADIVVMQENTEAASDGSVRILEIPEIGANIRARGQDIARGDVILSRGKRLRAQELGQLASLGRAALECYRPLRVALLSTGDELVEPGKPLRPGRIYNSNRFTAAGLLESWGFEALDFGIARDDPGLIKDALEEAAERSDVILTTGGVSVVEEDHVRDVVALLGGIDLWKIAIKPGKPFAFGHVGGTPFLGLPGNPVSVFITLVVVARPFLMDCQGARMALPWPLQMAAWFEKSGESRENYLRVRMTNRGLELFPSQSSGVLTSLCWSDGLVRQRAGEDIRTGDLVDYFPYETFF